MQSPRPDGGSDAGTTGCKAWADGRFGLGVRGGRQLPRGCGWCVERGLCQNGRYGGVMNLHFWRKLLTGFALDPLVVQSHFLAGFWGFLLRVASDNLEDRTGWTSFTPWCHVLAVKKPGLPGGWGVWHPTYTGCSYFQPPSPPAQTQQSLVPSPILHAVPADCHCQVGRPLLRKCFLPCYKQTASVLGRPHNSSGVKTCTLPALRQLCELEARMDFPKTQSWQPPNGQIH